MPMFRLLKPLAARAGWGGRYDIGCYEYDTRSSGTAGLAYDAAGGLTSDGDKLYEYDAVGRLTYAAGNANTNVELARYAYDALGRLAMQITYDYRQDAADPYDQLNTTRYFYYDNQRVIEQRDSDSVTDEFVWGPAYVDELLTHDRDSDGNGSLDQRLYGVHDRLYSVLAVVDEHGDPVEEYAYSPYGADPLDPRTGVAAITDADTGLPLSPAVAAGQYLYTGRSFDEVVGLNYHRARRLSHNLGRWTRRDPLGMAPELMLKTASRFGEPNNSGNDWELILPFEVLSQYSDGPDVYAYVRGAPTRWTDPTGEFTSLMWCLKSPANLLFCIQCNITTVGQIAKRYVQKGEKLVKLLVKWGGKVIKGGRGSHTKVKMPSGRVEIVPKKPSKNVVEKILKKAMEEAKDKKPKP